VIRQELQPIPLRGPQNHSPKAVRILAAAQPAAELDLLVHEDVSVVGHRTARHDAIPRGGLQAGHEIHAGRGQLGKPRHLEVPTVKHQDRAGRKPLLLRHGRLSPFPLRDHQDRGQVAVVVQGEMQFHGALGPTKGGPRKHFGAELDQRGVETQQLVLEPKLLRARRGLSLTPGEQLVKDGLIQLPRPMRVGIRERGPAWRGDAQMGQPTFTARQASGDFPQRVGSAQLAEQHRDELPPAGETTGVAFGVGLLHRALKFQSWKELEQLAKDAAESHRGWPPADAERVWRLNFRHHTARSAPFFMS